MSICVSDGIDDLVRGLLRPDERVIWIKRPHPGIKRREIDRQFFLFDLVWGVFPLVMFVLTLANGSWLGAVAILPFVALGQYCFLGRLFLDARHRAAEYYILTNERVIFACTDGRKIRSSELRWIDQLDAVEVDGQIASLVVGKAPRPRFWNMGGLAADEMFRPLIGDRQPTLHFVQPFREVRDSIIQARDAWLLAHPGSPR